MNDVNNVNDPNPEIDRTFTGLSYPDGSSNNQVVLAVVSPGIDQIAYGGIYYWWIRVWDNYIPNNDSDWIAGPSFITESHPYPWVSFSSDPLSPSAGEVIEFTDETTYYTVPPYSRDWDFGNGQSSTDPNPTYAYPDDGPYDVVLKATDADGYSCSTSPQGIGVEPPLPEWQEVAP